ncbi:MAG: phosphonate metabolism protein/1,5-bisphosphokinase (PRPP-forming) PhnN [Ferruginibacter sp.]|nr:phosphonate metabolism protein/1,5-bisphosphokinase (PRPP-forming) PhnN [Cytophagales bacterium]
MPSGNLFYVIGPSGAGKDTLMNYAREKMNGRAAVRPVLFAHRYITRPAEAGGENHVCLSPTEFAQRKALGFFALDWQSHGNGYGIGTEIRTWLGGGAHVVVNGSREYLAAADERFPDLRVVLISVSPEVLRQRLVARGRETAGEIERRIDRSRQIAQVHHPRLLRLDNDAPLEESGARFIEMLAG